MEGQVRGQTTPDDLGARAQLLVEKHAAYIKRVADVSCSCRICAPLGMCLRERTDIACSPKGFLKFLVILSGQRHVGGACH